MATKKPTDKLSLFVQSYWNGGQPLWSAFWVYGILGGAMLRTLLLPNMREQMMAHGAGGMLACVAIIASGIAVFMYTVWSIVSIWRCAKNVSNKIWFYLARLICLAVVIAGLIMVFCPKDGLVHKMKMHRAGYHEMHKGAENGMMKHRKGMRKHMQKMMQDSE